MRQSQEWTENRYNRGDWVGRVTLSVKLGVTVVRAGILRTLSVVQSFIFATVGIVLFFSGGMTVWFRLAVAIFAFGQSIPLLLVLRHGSRQKTAAALFGRYIMLTVAGLLAGIGLIRIGGWGCYLFAYGSFGLAWAFGWASYRIAKELRDDRAAARPPN